MSLLRSERQIRGHRQLPLRHAYRRDLTERLRQASTLRCELLTFDPVAPDALVVQWGGPARAGLAEEVDMGVRRWLPVVVALLLASGACGNDEDAELFAPDDLGSALLTPDDVADGFVEDERVVADERPTDVPPLDPGMWCDAAGDAAHELLALADDGGAFIEIVSTERAERNFHGVSEQLWSSPDTDAFVQRATTAIEACTGERWNPEDDEGTATVAALAGEAVGDDSTTALVTYVTPGPDGDYAWRGRTLVARFGATVMILQELDVQLVDREPFFTDADWQRIVDVAADRVEALHD